MDSVSISTAEVTVGSYHMTSQKIVFCTYIPCNLIISTRQQSMSSFSDLLYNDENALVIP